MNFLANLSVDPEVIKLSMGKKKSTCKSVVSKSASSRKLGIAFEDSSEDEGFMYRVGNSNCSLLGDKAVRNDESGSEEVTISYGTVLPLRKNRKKRDSNL